MDLSDVDIAGMRTTANSFREFTVTVERPNLTTRNAAGGVTPTYSTIATGVKCDITSVSTPGPDSIRGGKWINYLSWVAFFDVDQDIQPQDRFTDQSGRVFHIIAVDVTPGSDFDLMASVQLQ